MASNKDALRRQRRRELDARRSKSRVRLGPCLHRWGNLKDRLGFTLHSELAQYLLDSYLSKACKTCQCSQKGSIISASVEMLSALVVLVHTHSQSCPHSPSLQQQQQEPRGPGTTTGAPPRQGGHHRQKSAGTPECELENGVVSSTLPVRPIQPGEVAAAGVEICCLRFACEDGHVFSWWPRAPEDERGQAEGTEGTQAQEMEGMEEMEGVEGGMGRAEAPTAQPARGPLVQRRTREAGPSREAGGGTSMERGGGGTSRERGGGGISREGGGGGSFTSGMRTRSRRGAVQTTCPPHPEGGAEEKSGEQSSSRHTSQVEYTEESSTPIELHTGSDEIDPESPEASPHRAEAATSPTQTTTGPEGSTDRDDHSTHSRGTDRSSLLKEGSPQTGDKRKRKATPKEMFLCTYEGCEKIFSSRQYLNFHMKYQHVHQKTFCCSHPSCGKSFNFKKHLKEHEKLHSNQRDYICEFCARAFRTNSNLLTHRRIHTGEKPLQCEVCGFTCNQKASLNWHMKKHNAESSYKFPCDICGRRFEKRDNVTAHRSKSHPDHTVPVPSVPPAATAPGTSVAPATAPASGPSVPPAAPASGTSVPDPATGPDPVPNPDPALDPDPVLAPCPAPVSPLPPTHSPPLPTPHTSPLPSSNTFPLPRPSTSPPAPALGSPASPLLVPPPASPLLVPPPASPLLVCPPPVAVEQPHESP